MRRKSRIVDPLGWDERVQRIHDITPMPYFLLHHSTCWCRKKETDEQGS